MNNNYTDHQLQLALAKMLPKGMLRYSNQLGHIWMKENATVEATEWLHVCWLVECNLEDNECFVFERFLKQIVMEADWGKKNFASEYSASWQQRAIALAKVKGIEIV